MNKVDAVFDWIFRSKRCPYCVAPFPILKCLNFDSWQCSRCETNFSLDEDGDLEPVYDASRTMNSSTANPFFKATSSQMNGILCESCTNNQQKIIQLLQAFDSDPRMDHSKQYDLYSKKIESRYPLCATCSYRVSEQLKKCDEAASLQERRQNGSRIGGDWRNKLKLAHQMRWKHMKRRITKRIFFWPDFIFQLYLIGMCVFKHFAVCESERMFQISIFKDNNMSLNFWFPENNHFNFQSFFFVISLMLFLVQFNGIALNRRGMAPLIPQILLFSLRAFIGNFLHLSEADRPIGLNSALVLSAVGLAIVYTTGTSNCQLNRSNFKVISPIVCTSEDRTDTESTRSFKLPSLIPVKTNLNNGGGGFASYSEGQHRFHSFANQGAKSIMPWPEKPLPGRISTPPAFTFDENSFNNANKNEEFKRIRPTRLVTDDPLELEPMFSSFSLSDPAPRKRVISPSVTSTPKRESVITTEKRPLFFKPAPTPMPLSSHSSTKILNITYNSLLTAFILIGRLMLMSQTSLVAVVLACSFGLRGFIWPLLSFKYQLGVLLVAIVRLSWLAAELSGKFILLTSQPPFFPLLALTLDLILIILR